MDSSCTCLSSCIMPHDVFSKGYTKLVPWITLLLHKFPQGSQWCICKFPSARCIKTVFINASPPYTQRVHASPYHGNVAYISSQNPVDAVDISFKIKSGMCEYAIFELLSNFYSQHACRQS